jgi:hypothetical protein
MITTVTAVRPGDPDWLTEMITAARANPRETWSGDCMRCHRKIRTGQLCAELTKSGHVPHPAMIGTVLTRHAHAEHLQPWVPVVPWAPEMHCWHPDFAGHHAVEDVPVLHDCPRCTCRPGPPDPRSAFLPRT